MSHKGPDGDAMTSQFNLTFLVFVYTQKHKYKSDLFYF